MGGTRLTWINQAANLVALCGSGTTGCHGWIEKNRTRALTEGWLISQHTTRTATDVALPHARCGHVRLTNDGGHEPAD